MTMHNKSRGISAVTAALLIVIVVLVSSLGLVLVMPELIERPALTSTSTITTRVTSTETSTQFGNFAFVVAGTTCLAYFPCWGFSHPYVFMCASTNFLSGPATPAVCSQFFNEVPTYNITITIPVANQSKEPNWANCSYSVDVLPASQGYAYCIVISANSTSGSFIVAQPFSGTSTYFTLS